MEIQNYLLVSASEILIQTRKERGMTQEQLSVLSGISRQQISKIERKISQMSIYTYWCIAIGLSINPVDFVKKIMDRLDELNPNWKEKMTGAFKEVADESSSYLGDK